MQTEARVGSVFQYFWYVHLKSARMVGDGQDSVGTILLQKMPEDLEGAAQEPLRNTWPGRRLSTKILLHKKYFGGCKEESWAGRILMWHANGRTTQKYFWHVYLASAKMVGDGQDGV